jgi:hypothetical protein
VYFYVAQAARRRRRRKLGIACHTGEDGGMSMKASDYSCVPLTAEEHREYHRIGKRAFEKRYRISFARACKQLVTEWRKAA